MGTIALEAVVWLEAHPDATSSEKQRCLAQVPAWQWRLPGGHWPEMAVQCCNRVQPLLERRPSNALNVEIGAPAARCLYRPPDGRGVTRDGGTMDYLRSGGSILAYGVCAQAACDRAKGIEEGI